MNTSNKTISVHVNKHEKIQLSKSDIWDGSRWHLQRNIFNPIYSNRNTKNPLKPFFLSMDLDKICVCVSLTYNVYLCNGNGWTYLYSLLSRMYFFPIFNEICILLKIAAHYILPKSDSSVFTTAQASLFNSMPYAATDMTTE